MKIGIISEYYYPDNMGSTGTVLSHLSRYLRDHYGDVEIEVVTSKHLYRGGDGRLPSYEEWDGIRIFRVNSPRTKQQSTVLRLLAGLWFALAVLVALLRRPRYDLVLVVTNPPTLAMAAHALRRLRGTPYVYLIHDLFPDVAVHLDCLRPGSRVVRFSHAMQHRWLHAAARVVVLGRCMKEYLQREYALPARQVEVITNWADAEAIVPRSTATAFRVRNALAGFVVLYAGNIGQHQDFDNILQAARALKVSDPHITFAFVGDGAKKDYLARVIADESLTNVRLFPFVPDEELGDLMASADLSLVTLEPGMEGLGVPSKLYNIMASGRPVLAVLAAFSEVARVLRETGCGVQVEQGDVAQLTAAIRTLAADPATAARMGEQARQALLADYTLAHVAQRYYETFRAVTGVTSKPPVP